MRERGDGGVFDKPRARLTEAGHGSLSNREAEERAADRSGDGDRGTFRAAAGFCKDCAGKRCRHAAGEEAGGDGAVRGGPHLVARHLTAGQRHRAGRDQRYGEKPDAGNRRRKSPASRRPGENGKGRHGALSGHEADEKRGEHRDLESGKRVFLQLLQPAVGFR